jgi:hypothetical protein
MKRNTDGRDGDFQPASSTNGNKRYKSSSQPQNQPTVATENIQNPANINSYQAELNRYPGIQQSLNGNSQSTGSNIYNSSYFMPQQRNLAEYSLLGLPAFEQNTLNNSSLLSASEARNTAAAMNLSVLQRLLQGPNQAADVLYRNIIANEASNAALQRANHVATASSSNESGMMYNQNSISSPNRAAYGFKSELDSRSVQLGSLSQK